MSVTADVPIKANSFTASEVAELAGVEEEQARRVLEALRSLGALEKKGRKYYAPANGNKEVSEEIRRFSEVFRYYFPDPKELARQFDEVYARVADNAGYAQLKTIRLELGLSQEVFYRALRSHIEEAYYLIAGGEEGFVRKGAIYGIVKVRK